MIFLISEGQCYKINKKFIWSLQTKLKDLIKKVLMKNNELDNLKFWFMN